MFFIVQHGVSVFADVLIVQFHYFTAAEITMDQTGDEVCICHLGHKGQTREREKNPQEQIVYFKPYRAHKNYHGKKKSVCLVNNPLTYVSPLCQCTHLSARLTMYVRVSYCQRQPVRPSVRPSVCLSVTLASHADTVQDTEVLFTSYYLERCF